MIRTQISMTEEQAEGLKRLAAVRQKSQAAVLRDALDQLLETEARSVRLARARAATGAWAWDRSETSTQHDRALGDAFAG